MKKQLNLSFRSVALASALFLSLMSPLAQSADVFGPPSTVDYQGSVLDGNGNPLAPTTAANYEMQFRLYDAQTGGTLVWAEKQLVTVKDGKFSVRLGEGSPILAALGGLNEGTVDHDAVGLPGAFGGKERFLGVTVVIPGQTPGEIQPRLAFLASPFSYVAGSAIVAQTVNQPAGSPPSSLNIGSVSYANQPMTASGTISATAHTVLVDSTTAAVAATLPAGTAALNHQLLITKKDTSANQITVAPPAGGTINGVANPVYLKVRGESVTIQNVGANDWWIVSESRDKTPVGTIISYASNNIPAGYIACDGALPNKTAYPELVAALGTAWGVPADNTKFRVPDLRGAFLRGRDNGRGKDDDIASRIADSAGGAAGDNVGSYEADAVKAHNHTINDPGHSHTANTYLTGSANIGWRMINNTSYASGPQVYSPSSPADGYAANATYATNISASTTGITINPNVGLETRPENYSVNYCIKY